MALTTPADVNREWLVSWSGIAKVAITIVPFAGIAFLWFTGVIREHIGEHEDHFFATIFFGSSIILVAMYFVWGASIGAVFTILNAVSHPTVDNDIFIFGFTFMNQIIGNYALRMAGVYMFSVGTIWTKSGVMPRWLSILTYLLAAGFLFFASAAREVRYVFPGWVFVVSVYILVLNYRRSEALGPEAD